jgi:hypothetical protein
MAHQHPPKRQTSNGSHKSGRSKRQNTTDSDTYDQLEPAFPTNFARVLRDQPAPVPPLLLRAPFSQSTAGPSRCKDASSKVRRVVSLFWETGFPHQNIKRPSDSNSRGGEIARTADKRAVGPRRRSFDKLFAHWSETYSPFGSAPLIAACWAARGAESLLSPLPFVPNFPRRCPSPLSRAGH